MEVKPGYRQTEVGIFPDEWECVKLGDLISLQRGHDLTWRDRRQGDVPVMGSAGQNGFHDTAIAKAPGVVLGRSGASFGQAHYCERDFWPHNTALYVTDFRGNDPRFVFYFLKSIDFSRHNSGGAQQSLNRNFISPIAVGVPQPPEQRAIAAALGDVDALLGGLERLIAKKCDLKQAAMQQLLTGQTRLPGSSGAWETVSLTEIVTKTAGFWGLEKRDVAHQNDVGVIRAGDISPEGRLTATAIRYFSDSEFAKARCKLGDVVITGSGSVGKVWWCDGRSDIAASNFVRILRPIGKRVDGRWLFQLLLSEATQRLMVEHVATGVMANLGSSFFTTEWLHLPPPSEQRGIAEVLSDMDAELAALEARRDKTRDLKQAMMQELLTGKTRLVKPEAAHA